MIDSPVSGGWVLLLMVAIVGFFFIRTLNKLDDSMKELTGQVQDLRTDHNDLRKDFDNKYTPEYVSGQNQRIAEIIFAKIKGITPP